MVRRWLSKRKKERKKKGKKEKKIKIKNKNKKKKINWQTVANSILHRLHLCAASPGHTSTIRRHNIESRTAWCQLET